MEVPDAVGAAVGPRQPVRPALLGPAGAVETENLARVPGGQIEALPADARQRAAELSTRSLELRREIRDLEAQLRAELDAIDFRLRLLNILVVPGIIIVLGIGAAIWRRARLARYLRSRTSAVA